ILPTVAAAERGLILVTGVTGSGKSSTMAAIVNHINQTQYKHVVTLENPIEFLHRDINSSLTQREIGVDTDDVRAGLHADLMKDPARMEGLHDHISEPREQYGTQPFHQHLIELEMEVVVTYEAAVAAATNLKEFERQLRDERRRTRVAAPAEATPRR